MRIFNRFAWMESAGLKVGEIHLHANEVATLRAVGGAFDELRDKAVMAAFPKLVGHLAGARVWESGVIPPGHAVLVPDGMKVEILDPACSLSLGLPT